MTVTTSEATYSLKTEYAHVRRKQGDTMQKPRKETVFAFEQYYANGELTLKEYILKVTKHWKQYQEWSKEKATR